MDESFDKAQDKQDQDNNENVGIGNQVSNAPSQALLNTKLLAGIVIILGVLIVLGVGAYFYMQSGVTVVESKDSFEHSVGLSAEEIRLAQALLEQNGFNINEFEIGFFGPYEQCHSDLQSREGVSPETKFCRVLQGGDEICTYYKKICQTLGMRIDAYRYYNGLPFFEGGIVSFIFSEEGVLEKISRGEDIAGSLDISTKPRVSARTAVNALRKEESDKLRYTDTSDGYLATLGILHKYNYVTGESRKVLVWKIEIVNTPHYAYVDANTAEVIVFYYFIE